jgi:hypothetical protein
MNRSAGPPELPIGNGPGGGGKVIVSPGMSAPRPGTPVYIDVPFTIEGSATAGTTSEPDSGRVTRVTVTFDGAPVTVTDDSGDWGSWSAVVTPGPGAHTMIAEATAGTVTVAQTVHVQAQQVLTCISPAPSGTGITVNTLSPVLVIQVATAAFGASAPDPAWQCTGPATLAASNKLTADTWQLTLGLPAEEVPAGGAFYPLTVTATTSVQVPGGRQNVSVSLPPLSLHAVDTSRPLLQPGTVIPDNVLPGTTPTIQVQATDRPAGAVFSGMPATGATVQFDDQMFTARQTVAGDPATWSVTLPAVSQAVHQVTVRVKDNAENIGTLTQQMWVQLQSWSRLEPSPRDPTLMKGLQARIADPAWLLARQTAFGELTGTDTGSPVSVRMRARASELTRLRPARSPGPAQPATGPGELLPPGGGPLEVLTEAEPEPAAGGPSRPLFAAQAGLHYRRLLQRAPGAGELSAYLQGLSRSYPLPPPPGPPGVGVPPAPLPGDPTLQPYVLGRIPDGERLYADLAAALRPPGPGSLPLTPALGGASPTVVTSVARQWLAWYDAVSGQELGHRDTWIPERMEYAFSVAAPGPDAETVLAAAELDTGRLDWHDFDLMASRDVAAPPAVSLGAVPADLPAGETSIVYAGVPAPVRFRGMPNRSWWDFEDGSIDFGAITAPAESLTTSVIAEFAMRYGNDHFIIPVPLAVGSVLRVDSLVVTDTFGEVILIRPVAEVDTATGPFRLFEHAVPGGTPARDPLLVLFPALGAVIEAAPLEEVHFIRDEATELVWAIEQTALGPTGHPADRTADALAHFQPLTPTPSDGTALPDRNYRLRTDVEANWYPFGIQNPATGNLLAMADVPPLDPSQSTPLPWGRILAPFAPTPGQQPQPGILMPIEEVTKAGAQVARCWRYARWTDGRQLSWIGRRVRPGRGPGSSGLSFDLAI